MVHVWILTGTFAAAIVESTVGSQGLYLPCFSICAYYFAATLGWRRSLPALAVVATCLDLALGRGLPVSLLTLPALAPIIRIWQRYGDQRLPLLQAVPGLMVGTVAAATAVLFLRLPGAVLDLPGARANLALLVYGALGGMLLTPLICSQLDRLARLLAFPRYQRFKRRAQGGAP
ncbi:MAG: hypothetical protein KAI66_19405 [Lentisphaeria bacterium]|nr:hypothetical protein [Lentisphaeria bacterium]